MDNIKRLDEILLSNDVLKCFYDAYSEDEFKSWLNSILPEVERCKEQEQRNPWHKYNVLDHILHSVEEVNKLSRGLPYEDRRLLAYTMLFHDIGKPACHITRFKDGVKIDSFFNHNEESAKIANRALKKLNFNEKQSKIIEKLVFKHDIFMFIKPFKSNNPYWRELTPDLIEEEIDDLNLVGDGVYLLKYLVMVGRADNKAQNEKMTGDALNLLDMFENMIEDVKSKE